MSKKKPPAQKPVSNDEIHAALGFLIIKVMDLDLKTEDGKEICPLFGFCDDCDQCFLDRFMTQYPPPKCICPDCRERIAEGITPEERGIIRREIRIKKNGFFMVYRRCFMGSLIR